MNILNFVGRIGRDAEVRDAGQSQVANLAIAYNYGRKGDDGKKPTQWVDAALWGARATALEQYLVKGQQVAVAIRDVHIKTFTKGDGSTGTSLCGDVVEISLIGDAPANEGGQRQAAPARQPARNGYAEERGRAPQRQASQRAANPGPSGFDDMDDDIPF